MNMIGMYTDLLQEKTLIEMGFISILNIIVHQSQVLVLNISAFLYIEMHVPQIYEFSFNIQNSNSV